MRGDHDFCLRRSHSTDTDLTSSELAATAGIEPTIEEKKRNFFFNKLYCGRQIDLKIRLKKNVYMFCVSISFKVLNLFLLLSFFFLFSFVLISFFSYFGLAALSRMWQHVKLSDVSLDTRPRYSLIIDEDFKKTNQPNKQTNKPSLYNSFFKNTLSIIFLIHTNKHIHPL